MRIPIHMLFYSGSIFSSIEYQTQTNKKIVGKKFLLC